MQGLLSLYDVDACTGGLCVISGSHLKHDEVMSYAGVTRNDFVPIPQNDPLLRHSRLVTCKAGDLCLWDSRTVHCNTPCVEQPTEEAGYPHDEPLRAVVYCCMTPRTRASKETLRARRVAFLARVGSTHEPHEAHLMAEGTPEQLRLAGLSAEALAAELATRCMAGGGVSVDEALVG